MVFEAVKISQSHGGTFYYVPQLPDDHSADLGWENPFRPGGDLSREADEIVNMIKEGKPITPTGDVYNSISNGTAAQNDNHNIKNGKTGTDEVTKIQVASAQNGTNSHQIRKTTNTANNLDIKVATTQTHLSNVVVPGPASASHVVIDEHRKKKGCCVIQ